MLMPVRMLSLTVLVALLASLSAAQGIMRGPSEFGLSTIVICTGHGVTEVTVNAQGEEVALAPECPDTITFGLGALASDPPGPISPGTMASGPRLQGLALDQRGQGANGPRAPPMAQVLPIAS